MSDASPFTRRSRSWVPVVVVAVALGLVVVIGLAAFGIFFAVRHVNIESATPDNAQSEFDVARQKFAGQKPFLELREDGLALNKADETRGVPGTKIQTLHVLAWDPDEQRIVRVDIPMWLVRLKGAMPGVEIVQIWPRVTPEEIDRLGPGLLVDHVTPRGQQVLLWTE